MSYPWFLNTIMTMHIVIVMVIIIVIKYFKWNWNNRDSCIICIGFEYDCTWALIKFQVQCIEMQINALIKFHYCGALF